ncbi:MAG: hypothetical protein VKQ33_14240 [Candidatus Sericytochromatia bacterium]|nr:hypothetical protein [Candidatus Sericytochromatia bacterium]
MWLALLGVVAVLSPVAPAAAGASGEAEFLARFRKAPVGRRLAALGHTPLRALALTSGDWVVGIYAPEQSATSNWDDETRLVRYRAGKLDYERVQFVSKAGKSPPGRLARLWGDDLDGDGEPEVLALGPAHGPVGKATLMIFHRASRTGSFDVAFRRRHVAPSLVVAGAAQLVFSYERPRGTRHQERFRWRDGWLEPVGGDARPVRWE